MLEVSELAVARSGRVLFEGLSLRLEAGDLALVLGANGAGKTSLLRVVAGLSRPHQGDLRWRGRALVPGDPEYGRERLYLGHQAGLKADLSVAENLRFLLQLQGGDFSRARLLECLEPLGLARAEHRPVRALSAGQRRRVALARLRLSDTRLWLLDEPLTNLDTAGQSLVGGWLGEHLAGGGVAMVASHAAMGAPVPGRRLQVELGS
jgi:heme exporter protein A